MIDVALMHKEIIKKLSLYENGVVAETMYNMGLIYSVNYGLSLHQIDRVANAIKKNNELAFFLWQQKERESKLLALRIFKDLNLEPVKIKELIDGIINVELAEQAAIQLFTKLDNSSNLAVELIKKEEFIQLSGFILISKIALIDKKAEDSIFISLIAELVNYYPNINKIYLKRGYAQAFLRIGLRNNELKNKVQEAIKSLETSNTSLVEYLDQEVNYYLKANN